MRLDRPTYREQEILVALVEHQTDRGIAAALGLSLSCVRAHLAHLRVKTGTENRVQLLRWALREARKTCYLWAGLAALGWQRGRRG